MANCVLGCGHDYPLSSISFLLGWGVGHFHALFEIGQLSEIKRREERHAKQDIVHLKPGSLHSQGAYGLLTNWLSHNVPLYGAFTQDVHTEGGECY